jgi:hypothetical protein
MIRRQFRALRRRRRPGTLRTRLTPAALINRVRDEKAYNEAQQQADDGEENVFFGHDSQWSVVSGQWSVIKKAATLFFF